MRLFMQVLDGQGTASLWSDRRVADYSRMAGMTIVPGTLNLETPLELYYLGWCKAQVNGVPCVILPQATPGKVEVVSDRHLRTALHLNTGDTVEVHLDIPNTFPEWDLARRIQEAGDASANILDVGCGRGKFHPLFRRSTEMLMIDGCAADLKQARSGPNDSKVCGLIQDILPSLCSDRFDLVIAIDVIEHLAESDAIGAIKEMKRITKKKVCLFTPLGIHPQAAFKDNPLQEHRSTWYPMDLEDLGFEVHVWPVFHRVRNANPAAMWAEWSK